MITNVFLKHHVALAILFTAIPSAWPAPDALKFEKRILTDKYYCDGINCGDFNRDGRMDVVAGPFWYEGPEFRTTHEIYPAKEFPKPPSPTDSLYSFCDILTSLDAHGWGLAWFEQVKDGGKITFREHKFMGDRAEESKYGVAFSQPHALDLADLDGDGLKDIIVGKRVWAHGPKGDIEPEAAPVLYWFQLTRGPGGQVRYVPHLVDNQSGAGCQVVAADVNGDGRPDILTVSKLGAFVFVNRAEQR